MNLNFIHNDTNKLINYLDNYELDLNKLTDNKYFIKLYDIFKNLYKKINENIFFKNINIKRIECNPNYFLKESNFTSDEIKLYINNNLKNCHKLDFENNTIIYFSKKKINLVLIRHMFMIINILKNIFNRTNFNQKVIFFETNKKKKFPKEEKILGSNEVNTGLTLLDLNKNGNIIIFRKEEVLKVLIHELIHSNLIDEKFIFSTNNNYLNKILCANYDIVLNEAFTETFATILNIFYIHINQKYNINDLDVMFKNEMKYSFLITTQIFKYNKIYNLNEILKNNSNKCKNIFYQNTNVFSYYILKNILLKNHIIFGKILEKYTYNYKINNKLCIDEIIKLLVKNMRIYNTENKFNFKDFDKNSLRLCLYELKF
jgi:hypothetical protein